jgi:phosphate acetyltransferase
VQLPEHIFQQARAVHARIVLPEGHDIRVIQAAAEATKQQLAKIVVLGNRDQIHKAATHEGLALDGVTIIDPNNAASNSQYAQLLVATRTKTRLSFDKALQQVSQPIIHANCMVASGDAEGCVTGATISSADVIRHAIRIVGQSPDYLVVSSFFLMLFDSGNPGIQGPVLFADCGLVINPNAKELAAIAAATARNAENLLDAPAIVAMLSFSTLGSARHPLVSKVREATKLLTQQYPNLLVRGEVQFDAAILPEVFESKAGLKGEFASPNVFIFPNLDAGNIAYKIAQRTSGATAIGPILQGLNKPVNDLSRGCTAKDIVQNIAVTACQVPRIQQ